jgi:hypothetical protein
MQQAVLDHGSGHEVGLARASTAPGALVARGLGERLEHASGFDGEHLNLSARI